MINPWKDFGWARLKKDEDKMNEESRTRGCRLFEAGGIRRNLSRGIYFFDRCYFVPYETEVYEFLQGASIFDEVVKVDYIASDCFHLYEKTKDSEGIGIARISLLNPECNEVNNENFILFSNKFPSDESLVKMLDTHSSSEFCRRAEKELQWHR